MQGQRTPEQALAAIHISWMAIAAGAVMVAVLGYALQLKLDALLPASPLWFLALALPAAPALLLIQRLRRLEAQQAREGGQAQALLGAYFLAWGLADLPVMLGFALKLLTGMSPLLAAGAGVTLLLMFLAKPDRSRRG